jgi:hypothetical protein
VTFGRDLSPKSSIFGGQSDIQTRFISEKFDFWWAEWNSEEVYIKKVRFLVDRMIFGRGLSPKISIFGGQSDIRTRLISEKFDFWWAE